MAEKTFEYELFKTGSNKELLLEIFSEIHPVVARKIKGGASLDEHASNFLEKVVSNKAKSELCHRLSLRLAGDSDARRNFTVPEYIKTAIKWVTKGE